MKKRVVGVKQFIEKNFIVHDFDGAWKASFGKPERNFSMIVYGESGNGKTSFCVKMAKYMARFGKVDYYSFEEGISATLQETIKRENLMEVQGKVMFMEGFTLNDMIERLKKSNGAKTVFIDSRDYMNLTTAQYKKLRKLFPRKAFVIIAWMKSDKPKGQYAKDIEFMCDIKVKVYNYVAYPRCRFGGNAEFVIWDKGQLKKRIPTLF